MRWPRPSVERLLLQAEATFKSLQGVIVAAGCGEGSAQVIESLRYVYIEAVGIERSLAQCDGSIA